MGGHALSFDLIEGVPEDFEVTAFRRVDDNSIMAIQHKPVYLWFFSIILNIGTPGGLSSIKNFIEVK